MFHMIIYISLAYNFKTKESGKALALELSHQSFHSKPPTKYCSYACSASTFARAFGISDLSKRRQFSDSFKLHRNFKVLNLVKIICVPLLKTVYWSV